MRRERPSFGKLTNGVAGRGFDPLFVFFILIALFRRCGLDYRTRFRTLRDEHTDS